MQMCRSQKSLHAERQKRQRVEEVVATQQESLTSVSTMYPHVANVVGLPLAKRSRTLSYKDAEGLVRRSFDTKATGGLGVQSSSGAVRSWRTPCFKPKKRG